LLVSIFFPYTTLFRSPEHGITRDIIGYNGIYYSGGIITDPEINEVRVTQDGMEHHAEIFKVDDHVRGWYVIFEDDSNDSYEKTTDRKSTRLNSSHVSI